MTLREDSVNQESSHTDQGAAMEDMDLPVTVTGNGRTISLGTITDSNQMDTTLSANEGSVTANPDGEINTIDGDGDDETSARITESASAMKFQPLQPISEKSLFPNPQQPISGNSSTQDQTITQAATVVGRKESGSFMNNIQDPVAASKVFKKSLAENDDENLTSTQQMSHTPPTSMSTSYETMHFGKRPRSGVSHFVA